MTKRILLIFCMFMLVLPIVSAVGGHIRLGGNYSLNASDYIIYDRFNVSDRKIDGHVAATGQSWGTLAGDAFINDTIANWKYVSVASRSYINQNLGSGAETNYTCDLVIRWIESAAAKNVHFDYMADPNGAGTEHIRIGDVDANANLEIYTGGADELVPTVVQYAFTDTTTLWRMFADTVNNVFNFTVYNLTEVGGVAVLKELGAKQITSAPVDDVDSLRIWAGTAGHGFNVTELACYRGNVRPAGVPGTPPIPPPGNPNWNFTVTAKDYYDNSAINSFELYVENASNSYWFTTTNGVIYVTNLTIASVDTLYDFRFVFSDYFGITYYDVNFTKAGSLEAKPHQAEAFFNNSEIITNKVILDYWVNDGVNVNKSNVGGIAKLLLKAGAYTILVNSSGYLNTKINFSIEALDLLNFSLIMGNTNLTILPFKVDGKTPIENFTVNITSFNYDYAIGTNLSKYNASFLLMNGTYNISIRPKGFAFTNLTYKINYGNFYPNLTFSLYTQNSFNFSILDEIIGRTTNLFNGRPVIIEMVGELFSYNFSTTTGKLFVDLLTPQEYRIHYYSPGYYARDFYFTLVNDTHNTLELYLLSEGNSTDVTFTIVDDSGIELENAYLYAKRYYVDSNSYRTVAMSKTNAEGESIINLDYNDAYYQILATYGSYSTQTAGAKIFSLTPTIKIQTTGDKFTDIDTINNVVTNLDFNNATKTFTYTFLSSSPVTGVLQVERVTPKLKTIVCTNSDTTISGTVLCTITPTADTHEIFNAYGYIDAGGYQLTNLKTFTQWTDIVREKLQTTGVFLSMLMAGTFAGLGAFSPVLSVIMFLIGMMGVAFFGFSSISWAIYFSIFILGGILIYKLKN